MISAPGDHHKGLVRLSGPYVGPFDLHILCFQHVVYSSGRALSAASPINSESGVHCTHTHVWDFMVKNKLVRPVLTFLLEVL